MRLLKKWDMVSFLLLWVGICSMGGRVHARGRALRGPVPEEGDNAEKKLEFKLEEKIMKDDIRLNRVNRIIKRFKSGEGRAASTGNSEASVGNATEKKNSGDAGVIDNTASGNTTVALPKLSWTRAMMKRASNATDMPTKMDLENDKNKGEEARGNSTNTLTEPGAALGGGLQDNSARPRPLPKIQGESFAAPYMKTGELDSDDGFDDYGIMASPGGKDWPVPTTT